MPRVALALEDWKAAMPVTHAVAKRLATQGKVILLQGGSPLNLAGKPIQSMDLRGTYRIRIA